MWLVGSISCRQKALFYVACSLNGQQIAFRNEGNCRVFPQHLRLEENPFPPFSTLLSQDALFPGILYTVACLAKMQDMKDFCDKYLV